MISSLFAGISGLNANSSAMRTIGDNIANVNTTAFKGSSMSFANLLSASLEGTIDDGVGRGAAIWGVEPSWSQGALENTNDPLDLAMNGKGFFIVNDDDGASYYTRAGQFHFDEKGYLMNPDALRVQGYEVGPSGNLGAVTDIFIPGERMGPPTATTEFSFDINLNAEAAAGDTFTTSQRIYDSLGKAIALTLTFTNTTPGQWDVAGSVPSSAGGPVTINGATSIPLTFDADGELISPTTDATLEITLTNGATSPQTVTWDIYDALGNNLGDMTGYSGPSITTFQYQNGYPSGVLRDISVGEDGMVTAHYSNGQLMPYYQIALADFPSYHGLTKMGSSLYTESLASGQPLVGTAGSGRLGDISPSSLEMSNVDLAQEFVKLITTQRAYQANSRVITASDEMLAELMNIKR
jgi:flagellar hook protein FlgE